MDGEGCHDDRPDWLKMTPQANSSRTGVIVAAVIGAFFLGWIWGVLVTMLLVLGGIVGPSVSVAELSQWQLPSVVWFWGGITALAAALATGLGLSYLLKE